LTFGYCEEHKKHHDCKYDQDPRLKQAIQKIHGRPLLFCSGVSVGGHGICDRATDGTELVDIDSKHPPNQKKTNDCDQNMTDPLARRLGIAKIKHAAIVASSVEDLEKGWRSFVVQQPALALNAAAVAGEGAVRTNDPVTRNDDCDRIRSVGESDGADCRGAADALGEFTVRSRRTAGNLAQSPPDFALKCGASGLDGQIVDDTKVSGEVTGDCIGEAVRITRRFEKESVGTVLLAQLVADRFLVVGEEGDAQIAAAVSDQDHLADGSGEAIEK
jgi:hypothetical protein